MVPTLTDAEDLQLRGNELALIQSAESAPEAVAALAASLLRQNKMQESIIRQATHRIAELEAREALAERANRDWDFVGYLVRRSRSDWEIISGLWRRSA